MSYKIVADSSSNMRSFDGVAFANAQHLSSWEGKTVEMPIDGKRFYKLLSKKIEAAKAKKK